MIDTIEAAWSPLAATPLFWIVVTVGSFLAAKRLNRICNGSAAANPVLLAILLTAVVVAVSRVPYPTYFAGAQFINFLLGPTTVALAVPMARNMRHIKSTAPALALALTVGLLVSISSGIGLVWLLGGSHAVALSMAPKNATTPIAIVLSQQIGGLPALTATLAILGGIISAMIRRHLFSFLSIDDHRTHGFVAGVVGSGVAAAEVSSLSGLAAGFAALGIALNGAVTALVMPLLAVFWH